MMKAVVLLALGVAVANAAFSKTSSCKCGQDNSVRIVGGNNAGLHEYPWQVALTTNGYQFCGGSLINDRYILTAAHCTAGSTASDIVIRLGEHNLSTGSETSKTITRRVSEIIDHSGYDDNTLYHDISLLKLSSPVPISSEVLPVCLPPPNPTYAGKTATVTGWGTTSSGGSSSSILKEVAVPVLSNAACKSTYSDLTINQVCAGKAGKDSCQGDSGGPLTFIDGGGNHDQIGVVSYGIGCGDDGYPGVYTRVSKYRNWIDQNTQDATYCAGFA